LIKPLQLSNQRHIAQLWGHIPFRRRLQLSGVAVLMVLASVAEVASIGSIIPFLVVLTSPKTTFSHALSQPLIKLLEITQEDQLLLALTSLFIVAVLVSGAIRQTLLFVRKR